MRNLEGFQPINKPYVYGYQFTRADGITVEVVRVYQGEWTVFLMRGFKVVACSIELYRRAQQNLRFNIVSFQVAMKIARQHAVEDAPAVDEIMRRFGK